MCGSVFPVSVCAGREREIEREGGRESETGTEDWMYECGSVCWRETHENGDKDKGRDSGGGATNGGELSRALRVSVSQSELWSEISWFFTGSAAHYLGGERGERVGEDWGVGRRRGSAFNLTRLICLPHLSGFYSLLLARPLSNLFGQANTRRAKETWRTFGGASRKWEGAAFFCLPLCSVPTLEFVIFPLWNNHSWDGRSFFWAASRSAACLCFVDLWARLWSNVEINSWKPPPPKN